VLREGGKGISWFRAVPFHWWDFSLAWFGSCFVFFLKKWLDFLPQSISSVLPFTFLLSLHLICQVSEPMGMHISAWYTQVLSILELLFLFLGALPDQGVLQSMT
jgi:hypothetical protein